MRKKLLLSGGIINILFVACVYELTSSWRMTIIVEVVLLFFVFFSVAVFLFLNRMFKKTNGYKNAFRYTSQFVSNIGYRDDLVRNYEVVNLGSNPARFAFIYTSVLGQNWSTGSQSLNYDFRILKYYHSYLKSGAVVILPLVVFSSCYADELTSEPEYHLKFNKILPSDLRFKNDWKTRLKMRYPFLSHPLKAVRFLLRDCPEDTRILITDQAMDKKELIRDAEGWIKGWKQEFDISGLDAPLSSENLTRRQENVKILRNMIDFCLERELKPVLLIPPMTSYLSSHFSKAFRENYIYSFVKEVNVRRIPFLDYMDDGRFCDPDLYFNSFFLNLKGRKLFTQQVLKDLQVI